jgi:hypothetical protein
MKLNWQDCDIQLSILFLQLIHKLCRHAKQFQIPDMLEILHALRLALFQSDQCTGQAADHVGLQSTFLETLWMECFEEDYVVVLVSVPVAGTLLLLCLVCCISGLR